MTNEQMYESITQHIGLVGERDCAKFILPALESIIRNMAMDEPVPKTDIITLDKYLPVYSDSAKIHSIIRQNIEEKNK